MNIMKIVLIGGLIVVLFMAVGLYYLFSSLDSIVKNAIEHHGSQITGSSVTVKEVQLSLSEGKGELRGVRIANPPGFSSEPAFTLEEVVLQIDIGSISSNPIIIDDIQVIAPYVRFETNDEGQSNMDVLSEKIRSSADSTESSDEADGSEPRLRIKQFVFDEGTIHASIPQQEQEITVKLPSLSLKNVGGSEGQPPEVVGQVIMNEFVSANMKAVGRKGLERIIDENLKGEAGEAAKSVLDAILQ